MYSVVSLFIVTISFFSGGGLGGTRKGAPHECIKYSGRVDDRYVILIQCKSFYKVNLGHVYFMM